ncbi:MAG: NAD-dependent epimerase/dehydratase family protein [Chloroflexota bacterium]
MNILVIGGTQFVGRAIVEAAMARGHQITLFHRGRTNPGIFTDAEHVHGDREHDLHLLQDRRWDAVIDTSGYVPRIVGLSVEKLANAVDHYTFISTVSVYDEAALPPGQGPDEDSPLAQLEDESVEDVTGETYGGLKVLCERTATAILGDKLLTIRPGLIVGPTDHTDRFTYWPVRAARGGRMLAPPQDAETQVIDVRDLGEWAVRMIEAKATGTFNAVGPEQPLNFGHILAASVEAAGARTAEVIHASEAFLLENDIQPWSEFPAWLPGDRNALMRASNRRAMAAGLTYRPIETTAADILRWYAAERGIEAPLRSGLDPDKEQQVLAAWMAQKKD